MKFINQTGLLKSNQLDNYLSALKEVFKSNNYDSPEGSINLPFDTKILEEVKILAGKKVNPDLKYIIDIGIGGSNLGTKAIYDALFGFFDILEPERFPKMIFADTNDQEFLSKLQTFLGKITNRNEVLINMISKSGGTTESTFNAEIILSALQGDPTLVADNEAIFSRLVVTSDKDSKLWNLATDLGISTLEIPKLVGGRYSVFSAVGIFPLLAAGIDVEKLLAGAADRVNTCLNAQENDAMTSASVIFQAAQNGMNIADNFFFHSELESVGKWCRQLMAESLGKDGKKVPTPTVSIGSTDLHSMAQLYLGGPKDKITTFVSAEKSKLDVSAPNKQILYGLVEGLENKKASVVMKAILEGVKIAYTKKQLPFMEVVLSEVSEYELGQFLQFKMLETMFLGKLFGVNTFDQPNVEDYKIETKQLLNS